MAELINFRIEGEKALIEGNLFDIVKAKHLMREAIDDIADATEVEASRQAPKHTGELAAHPVERDDTRFGAASTGPAFGGQRSIKGEGGRFIGATALETPVGSVLARSVLTIPKEPKHAIWVHEGTGIYGPRRKMITAHNPEGFMMFPASRWPTAIFKRAHYRFKEVKGQPANPYLDKAFFIVDGSYVPVRIELLRTQIAAET